MLGEVVLGVGVVCASFSVGQVGMVVLSVWWWCLGFLLCVAGVCIWCAGVVWSVVCGVEGWEGLPPAV